MKKFLIALLVAALAAAVMFPVSQAFGYGTEGVEADEMLLNTVRSTGVAEDISTFTIVSRDTLYDLSLQPNGIEYVFELDGKAGFAIVTASIDDQARKYGYDVEEVNFEAESPYAYTEGKKLYIDQMSYVDYTEDGRYLESRSKNPISDEDMQLILENNELYFGNGLIESILYTVDYKYKVDVSYDVPYGLPDYTDSSYSGSCANVVGAAIVAYYDIYYTNLIPNFHPINSNGKYVYRPAEVWAIADAFYFLMGTNVGGGGTTQAGFRNGLSAYINSRGYNVNYTTLVNGTAFNYDLYKTYAYQNKATALFLRTFNTMSILYRVGNTDYISMNYYDGGHMMAATGFRDISYYRDEEVAIWSPVWYNPFRVIYETQEKLFREDNYLRVNSGLSNVGLSYLKLKERVRIENALVVELS